MTDSILRLIALVALSAVASFLGRGTWRRLEFRCARRPARLWFAGMNVVFAGSAVALVFTGEPAFGVTAVASLYVANFWDAFAIRLLGGPDPHRLLNRLRSISERLLPESRTPETIETARRWARDLQTVRTAETGRVIDAVNRAIDAKYASDDYDIGLANGAWKEYHDAVVELQAKSTGRGAAETT